MLTKRRNEAAAIRLFTKALESNVLPEKIAIDKSGANQAGIRGVNRILARFACPISIQIYRSKYLDNVVEQSHRFIKRQVRPMLGFKPFLTAAATIDGIEVANMIRKGQFRSEVCPFRQFAQLSA